MSHASRAARAALFLVLAGVLAACNEAASTDDDLYARCKDDPNCRGQKCADVRAELYSRGEYKSASLLNCSPGRL